MKTVAAWENITFHATNGIGIGFRCRYLDASYFNVQRANCIKELTVNDNGSMSLFLVDELPDDVAEAYRQFVEFEARQFEEWKKRNAHLLQEA